MSRQRCSGRIFFPQGRRETVRADVVVAVQHGEAFDRAGQTDGRKSRMARRRIRSAVIHRIRDRNAGGHFVVQQSPHLQPQHRGDFLIQLLILLAGVAVNAAR